MKRKMIVTLVTCGLLTTGLFYQDAQIEADYTKIGTLTTTEGLVDAVRDNEPLRDWNCLVIPVRVTE